MAQTTSCSWKITHIPLPQTLVSIGGQCGRGLLTFWLCVRCIEPVGVISIISPSLNGVQKGTRVCASLLCPGSSTGEGAAAQDRGRGARRSAVRTLQVLSDPRSRKNYDYALAHPEDTLYNEYQYYYSRYEKYWKTDPKVVVLGFLAIISIIQYACQNADYTRVGRRTRAVQYLLAPSCGNASHGSRRITTSCSSLM